MRYLKTLQSIYKDTPNTLSGHHKPKDLTIQIKKSFIFIIIFKTYFLINSVSTDTQSLEFQSRRGAGREVSQCLMTPDTIKAFVTI